MRTRSGAVAAEIRSEVLPPQTVTVRAELRRGGFTDARIDAHLRAYRWQRLGDAVVLHNGPLNREERVAVALINCGPRAAVTGFTAAEAAGLTGWERDEIHVLVPGGARIRRIPGIRVRVHWTSDWSKEAVMAGRHDLAPALVRAASTFARPRPAIGIVAAAVQQRLTTVGRLRAAIAAAPRSRHRRALLVALDDIEQGTQALSEIDFARLCRRHHLPEPVRQAIRHEPSGRRRYLDVEFRTRSGRRLVVEIDGALHIAVRSWWSDQFRQNEMVISDSIVLRFPSAFARHEEALVIAQLRRALDL